MTKQPEEQGGDVVRVVVSRNIKRLGKEVKQGSHLDLPRAEYEKAPPGIYLLPGELPNPEAEQRKVQRQRADADRADKMRRIEAERARQEQEAARLVAQTERLKQLAVAGAARLRSQHSGESNALAEPPRGGPPAPPPKPAATPPPAAAPPPTQETPAATPAAPTPETPPAAAAASASPPTPETPPAAPRSPGRRVQSGV